jgi:7-cyano-7-deazaguanine synthase
MNEYNDIPDDADQPEELVAAHFGLEEVALPYRKAFVLLSGGLDSTTCLYKAVNDYAPDIHNVEAIEMCIEQGIVTWVEAISVDYGQRHKKEMEYAAYTCKMLGIKHTILDIGNLLSGKTVMLTTEGAAAGVEVPNVSYSDIKGVSPTYVPFRNGTLLSAITAHAQKWVNECFDVLEDLHGEIVRDPDIVGVHAGIYFGAHSEDAQNWAYPDCTPEFIGAMANAIYIGTYRAIRLHTPLQWLMKDEIVLLGDSLCVPFEHTWSCYKGDTLHCGTCPTCRSRKEAFEKAGVKDPTLYHTAS